MAKKIKVTNTATKLADVLKFLAPIQKRIGVIKQQFCNISYGWACASDEIITMGIPVEMNLFACPHFVTFTKALSECESEDLSITQLDDETLSVNSGVFKALVPCVAPSRVEIPAPDECIAQADNRLKAALLASSVAVEPEHANPAFMGVLVQAGSTVGINGHILLEYWHGIDLPPGLLVPKRSAEIVGKCKADLTGFGFSPSSVTFWFADGSFIKSQLLKADYPNYSPLFPEHRIVTVKLSKAFEHGIKALKNFAPDNNVYFFEGTLQTNVKTYDASTFKIEGLPEGMAFNVKYLLTMLPHMDEIYFDKANCRAFIFTKETRGIIMGVHLADDELADYKADFKDKPNPGERYNAEYDGGDIPF